MELSYRARMRLFVPLGGIAGAVLGSLLGIALLPGIVNLLAMAGAVLGVLGVGLYYAAREAAAQEREREREDHEREPEAATREQTGPPGDGNQD